MERAHNAQPVAAIIDVCGNCNSHCTYCDDWRRSDSDRLDLATIETALQDLRYMQVGCVCFSGGEPLLHPEIARCVSRAAELNIAPWLITNGILLSESCLQELVTSGLECCLLSIDSLEPEIYKTLRRVSFRVAQRALDVLEKTVEGHPDLDVILNCVITRANYNSVPELVEFAKTKGFYILFQPYEPRVMSLPLNEDPLRFREADLPALDQLVTWLIAHQRSASTILNTCFFLEHMSDYIMSRKMPQGFQCQAGELTVCLGSDGHLYPCWHLAPIGNVRQMSLPALWYGKDFERTRHKMKALDCPTCWTSCHLDMVHTIETLTHEVIQKGTCY
jgi:MoaA/NifB/PqqE/SkfB family radical SAM enzyme